MSISASERERWIERLRDAAIEATCSGAGTDELVAALREGVAEGRRLVALRSDAPTLPVPAPRSGENADRPGFTPEPGSALAALVASTGI